MKQILNKKPSIPVYLNRSKISLLCLSLLSTSLLGLSGCQTLQRQNADAHTASQSASPERLYRFNIRGKIGVVVPPSIQQATHAQSGSAFYVWAQEDNRFAIDMTGALGIGHTIIEFNGSTATLVNQSSGKLTATNPDVLLLKATGWRAPISQLPYWISGKAAPSDDGNALDPQGRLQTAQNADWTANFSYNNLQDRLPNKIKAQHASGYKIVLTIQHTKS